jgi:NTE family protein
LPQTLREWLKEAPFSLAMSSGFFGFFAHAGVAAVLETEGLRPQRMSGSSAGALIAGLWSAGVPTEKIRAELLSLKRTDFWDPWPGAGLLRGKLFREKLKELLPVMSIEACPTPCAVSVFDLWSRRTTVLTSGSLARAIHTSCALPVLFQPVWIDRRPYTDGGLADRPGLAGLTSGERVLYHHLASRSPWRSTNDPALRMPERPQTTTLVIEGITRVNPFALDRGARAFEEAARATQVALDKPLDGSVARQVA